MEIKKRDMLIGILILGSIWGFLEVVLGGGMKAAAIPYKGDLMTGLGIGTMAVAYAVYDTVRSLCEALLPDAFTLRLERAREQWPACWDFLGAEGDFPGSLREWDTRHNASSPTFHP